MIIVRITVVWYNVQTITVPVYVILNHSVGLYAAVLGHNFECFKV